MADRRGPASSRAAAPFAAAMLVLVLAGCSSTPPPSAAPLPTPSGDVTLAPSIAATLAPPTLAPTASAPPVETPGSGVAQCEPADVKASHGLVEGAAGSRFTTVELVAAVACSTDLFPTFGLRDANGAVLVGAGAAGPGRIDLVAGASYASNVRLANWCADAPAFPLRFELIVSGAPEEVTGPTSFPEDGDVPPCNGVTVGRILEATSWEPAP